MKTSLIFFILLIISISSFAQKVKYADSPLLKFDLSYLEREDDNMIIPDVFDKENKKNFLLIIAINKYTSWKPLTNPIKDAKDIKSVLLKKYKFKPEDVFELYDDQATPEGIRRIFERIRDIGTGNDNLVIYYSGHGHYDEASKEGFWVPVNGKLGEITTYVSNSTIQSYIKMQPHKHVFLMTDACFSGSMFLGAKGETFYNKVEEFKSRWGLASSSLEFANDGIEGENSPFASYVIKFLKENVKERFPVSEMIQYVKVAVASNTSQLPVGNPLDRTGHEGGELVFYMK